MAALLARNGCKLPFTAAARPAAAQRVRMVCKAQQQAEQPTLAQLAKPAVATVFANVVMAMPAAAEAGKLFVSCCRSLGGWPPDSQGPNPVAAGLLMAPLTSIRTAMPLAPRCAGLQRHPARGESERPAHAPRLGAWARRAGGRAAGATHSSTGCSRRWAVAAGRVGARASRDKTRRRRPTRGRSAASQASAAALWRLEQIHRAEPAAGAVGVWPVMGQAQRRRDAGVPSQQHGSRVARIGDVCLCR